MLFSAAKPADDMKTIFASNALPGGPGHRNQGWLSLPLLGYGFRPFFLLAGLHAGLAVPLWIALLQGYGRAQLPVPPLSWHAHEMLFGFVAAAIAGFLLTAVPSWTGQRGYAGLPLLLLVAAWMGGRVVMSAPTGLPPLWIGIIDLAFLPSLALTILPSLLRSGNRRNLVFILLLGLLFAANLQFHLGGALTAEPLKLAMNTMLLMLTILGGRIVPAFTSAALKQQGIEARLRRYQPLDKLALIAVSAVLVIDLVRPGGTAAAIAAAAGAALLGTQLLQWHGHHTLRQPIVCVLHFAYAWLAISLGLKAAVLSGAPIPPSTWLHALGAGAMATMIMAVMSRAALGHTGREIIAPGAIVISYWLLTAAACLRVFGPILWPMAAPRWMVLPAALWMLAFLIFVVVYAPILCSPRIDGRPG